MLAGMRMVFGPDDGDAFSEARGALLVRFERWLKVERGLGSQEAIETACDAGLALDWKWSYGDGALGLWRTDDVYEFLLDWCPRKLSVSPADCVSIPGALAVFTAFLGASRLLAPGSSTVETLAEATDALHSPFVRAMGESSNFGMAKTLFGAAADSGVDLTDPDQLQGWMEEFNAGSEEERRRVLPDRVMSMPKRPALPPVAMPEESEVAESKSAAPILAMFSSLAEFVGEGRKLTQTGNLTLADARVLVERLETGDAMDPQIGDRTFKTKSSAELQRLRMIVSWAKKAGVVRVTRGKVVATKRGLAVAGDPGGSFDRAVDALLAVGPVSSQRDHGGWFAWPEVDELLDRFAVHLLAGPYVAQRSLPIDDISSVAAEAVLDAFEFRSLDDEHVERRVAVDVTDMMDALELAGMLRRLDIPEPSDSDLLIGRRRHGGSVELTPAGAATTRRLLVDAGYEAPIAGEFAAATATELLLGTDAGEFGVFWGEIEAWRRRRDPAAAARELASAVRELEDPALRNLALAVLDDMDIEIAAPEVRRLVEDPTARGFAMCWLVDHGLEDERSLLDPDDASWFVDVLVQRLVTAGPDGLCDTLALAGGHDRQVAAISRMWRSPSTATDTILAAIGEMHPAKIVAKAARKARFQRRSWLSAT